MKVFVIALATVVGLLAVKSQATENTCDKVIEGSKQLIRLGLAQQIELSQLNKCSSEFPSMTQALADETIAHCAGAFWCYVIPDKDSCNDANSCHWVSGKK